MSHSILSNIGIATGGRIINVALGVIAIALLTRYLGPAGYGSYALLLAFGLVVQLVADFGLYLTLTRTIAEKPDRQAELISHTISLRFVLLLIAFAVGALLTRWLPSLEQLTLPFIIIAVGLIAQSLSQIMMGVFQHHQEVWRATIGDLIGRFIQIGAIIVLGVTAATVTSMVAIFAIASSITLLVHHYLLPRTAAWRFTVNWSRWQELLHVSWPLGAMLLLNAIYFRIDAVIISFFHDAAQVGWYSLAYRIVESALFFPAMFGGLLLPRLSANLARPSGRGSLAAARRARAQAEQYLTEGLQVLLLAAILGLLVLLLAASPIITLISGPEYQPAGPLLTILAPALAIMFIGNLFGFTLVALKQQRALLVLYASLAVFNLITNFMFIPRYGATAAAWTTVATEVLATTIAAWLVMRQLNIKISLSFLRPLSLAAVVTTLIFSVLVDTFPLLIALVLVTILYLALNYILGTLAPKHFRLLLSQEVH